MVSYSKAMSFQGRGIFTQPSLWLELANICAPNALVVMQDPWVDANYCLSMKYLLAVIAQTCE
jgi:hypothetical protein